MGWNTNNTDRYYTIEYQKSLQELLCDPRNVIEDCWAKRYFMWGLNGPQEMICCDPQIEKAVSRILCDHYK